MEKNIERITTMKINKKIRNKLSEIKIENDLHTLSDAVDYAIENQIPYDIQSVISDAEEKIRIHIKNNQMQLKREKEKDEFFREFILYLKDNHGIMNIDIEYFESIPKDYLSIIETTGIAFRKVKTCDV